MQCILHSLADLGCRVRGFAARPAQHCCAYERCGGCRCDRRLDGFLEELEDIADALMRTRVASPAIESLIRQAAGLWRANREGACTDPADVAADLVRIIAGLTRLVARTPELVPEHPHLFIGHGRRHDWRAVRDHLATLGVECVEFCDESPVGQPVTQQLERVIGGCSGAIIVATGEIERKDGPPLPRLNVVHELGIAQERFGRALTFVLAEEGVELPSNLDGVGVIRFDGLRITAVLGTLTKALMDRHVIPGPAWRAAIVPAARVYSGRSG